MISHREHYSGVTISVAVVAEERSCKSERMLGAPAGMHALPLVLGDGEYRFIGVIELKRRRLLGPARQSCIGARLQQGLAAAESPSTAPAPRRRW